MRDTEDPITEHCTCSLPGCLREQRDRLTTELAKARATVDARESALIELRREMNDAEVEHQASLARLTAERAEAWRKGYRARQNDLGAADITPNPYRAALVTEGQGRRNASKRELEAGTTTPTAENAVSASRGQEQFTKGASVDLLAALKESLKQNRPAAEGALDVQTGWTGRYPSGNTVWTVTDIGRRHNGAQRVFLQSPLATRRVLTESEVQTFRWDRPVAKGAEGGRNR